MNGNNFRLKHSTSNGIMTTNTAKSKHLSGNERAHLAVLARDQRTELLRRARENAERLVVHRNHRLHAGQQLLIRTANNTHVIHGIRRLLRTHGVEIADAEKGDIRSVDIVDQLHVAEHARITAVVNVVSYASHSRNATTIGSVDHETSSLASIQRLSARRRNAGRVQLRSTPFAAPTA